MPNLISRMPLVQYLPPPQPVRRSTWLKIWASVCAAIIVLAGISYSVNLFIGDDDGDMLSNFDEIYVYHTDPRNPDSDGDWILDSVELRDNVRIGLEVHRCTYTNPLSVDTDGGGVDDFNEVYTYGLNPRDPSDDIEFIANIPYVEARDVKPWDGGFGGPWPPSEKYIEVSLRDPLVKWYGNRTEIKWLIEEKGIVGKIVIPIIHQNNRENMSSVFPAYTLSHENVGLCVPQAFLNAVMLRLKGYKAEVVYGSIYEDEELIGHAWVETKIDGKDYIASWENLYPRSAYYDEWIMRP